MGSEKSVTQAGNGNAWGVENKNVGVEIGVGVCIDSGVMDGMIVNDLFGTSARSAGRSSAPQAKVNMIVLIKKNKDFISFIFPFHKM